MLWISNLDVNCEVSLFVTNLCHSSSKYFSFFPHGTHGKPHSLFLSSSPWSKVPNFSICCFVFLSLSGKSGSKTFVAKRFLPRGEKEKDGVTVIEMNCTYFWAPLAEIDFSVGVVVPVSHAKDQLNSLTIPPGRFLKSRYLYRWCCN